MRLPYAEACGLNHYQREDDSPLVCCSVETYGPRSMFAPHAFHSVLLEEKFLPEKDKDEIISITPPWLFIF